MGYYDFPHTRNYDTDLGYLIKQYLNLREEVNNLIASQTIVYADPLQWSIDKQYRVNTIVINGYNAYLSKQPVPLGIEITNTDYWLVVGDFIREFDDLRANIVDANAGTKATTDKELNVGDLVWWNDILYQVISYMPVGTAFVVNSNILKITIKDYVDKKDLETLNNAKEYSNSIRYRKIDAINYGFKNDGITLNDDIMASYIANDSDKEIYFPSGVYLFSHGFNFPNTMYLTLSGGAELKLSDNAAVQDYFITIRKDSTRADYATTSFITGGTINGNYKTNCILAFNKTKGLIAHDITLLNSLKYGISSSTKTSGDPDGAVQCSNIVIENTKDITETEVVNTCGIYDKSFDSQYRDIEICNYQTGIYTINGLFENTKIWLRSRNLIENSKCVLVDGNCTLTDCVFDTYRKGIVFNGGSMLANVVNLMWIINTGVYTTELQSQYPQTIFNETYDWSRFNVVNMIVPSSANNLSFANIPGNDLTLSSFYNIKPMSQTANPSTYITNFRNDKIPQLLTVTKTTDQFGQFAESAHKLMTMNTDNCFAIRVNDGYKIFSVSDSGVLSLKSNAQVTFSCLD